MRKEILVTCIFTLLCFFQSFAQQKTITGKVTSAVSGQPLVGATIAVKGTPEGTQTNLEGNFTITVPASSQTIVISSVGYETQTISVDGRATIDVQLSLSNSKLNEVVVVGYGSTKRKDLTGAVSSISAKEIEKVPVTTLAQALQGRAPGVQVTNDDGAPGGGVQVQIRGVGSLGNNDPLYVVDGYPISGGINTLNPDDIATIDVLKDASATAIYGNRASNGVVIITTKRGKNNGVQISLDANDAIQAKPKMYNVLNAQQWGALAYAHSPAAVDGYTPLPNWANADTLHEANWQDAIYQQGLRQNYNVAIRGGSDKVSSAFSIGYLDQKGIVLGSDFKRFNLSTNLDYKAFKWLKSSTSFKYSRGNSQVAFGTGGQGAGAGLGYLTKLPPTLDGGNLITSQIKDGMGNYGFFNPNNQSVRNWGSGPVYNIETQDQKNLTNYFLG
ncbi:MAG: SusC/RagA family TonB-linked outer membrane protein, partial [Ginsengibacter sp.]